MFIAEKKMLEEKKQSSMKKRNKNGNVPNLRFPEFQSLEWERKTLDNLCNEFKSGKNIRADEITENGSFPVFGGNGLRGFSDQFNYNGEFVLIGRQGALCGNVRIIQGKCYMTEHAIVVHANEKNSTKFLLFLLDKMNLGQYSDQSAQPGLAVNKLLKIAAKVPNLQEQEKIARFLTLIDERISTQSKIIEKYESLIKGIKNCVLYHPRAQKIALKNILIDRNERSVTNNQYKILSSTTKGLFLQSEYFDREIASENNIGYKVVNINDIIISPQNLWMGNITFNERFENGLVSPSYKVYAIDESFNKYFVAAILKTHRALHAYLCVSEQGASIVRRNLNIELFNELTFSIPSIEMQDKIGGFLKSLDSKLKLEKNFLKLLKQQKIYLLKQMFI